MLWESVGRKNKNKKGQHIYVRLAFLRVLFAFSDVEDITVLALRSHSIAG